MNLAEFVARDPYRPEVTKEELDELLDRMDGVIDWRIDDEGKVAVEYDRHRISDGLIEDALAGIGFQLHHLFDERNVSSGELREALGH